MLQEALCTAALRHAEGSLSGGDVVLLACRISSMVESNVSVSKDTYASVHENVHKPGSVAAAVWQRWTLAVRFYSSAIPFTFRGQGLPPQAVTEIRQISNVQASCKKRVANASFATRGRIVGVVRAAWPTAPVGQAAGSRSQGKRCPPAARVCGVLDGLNIFISRWSSN